MKGNDKKVEEMASRIKVSKVLEDKDMGVRDKATVVPARVAKGVPKPVLDYLGITAEEPDIIWLKMIDDKTNERIVVLLKDKGNK